MEWSARSRVTQRIVMVTGWVLALEEERQESDAVLLDDRWGRSLEEAGTAAECGKWRRFGVGDGHMSICRQYWKLLFLSASPRPTPNYSS